MYTTRHMLLAIKAFVRINSLEMAGVDYIDRLAEAVKTLEYDEDAFEVFSNMFDNQKILDIANSIW